MNYRILYALIFGVMIGLLSGFLTFWNATPPITTKNTLVPIGGSFTLEDVSGKQRTEKDFFGKPMLVFFGFTNCPDICPSGLQTLTIALHNIGKFSKNLTPLFVSIDPERDTPQVMGKYLESFHSTIQGLTGSPEQIQKIIKAYRVYAKKTSDPSELHRYFFDHSSFFYLMDSEGKYVKHFPSSISAETLSSELTSYLSSQKIKE
ncbi:MAG: SCO family protein [Hyphomicrobium sp.]